MHRTGSGGGGGMALGQKRPQTLLFEKFAEASIALMPHLLLFLRETKRACVHELLKVSRMERREGGVVRR